MQLRSAVLIRSTTYEIMIGDGRNSVGYCVNCMLMTSGFFFRCCRSCCRRCRCRGCWCFLLFLPLCFVRSVLFSVDLFVHGRVLAVCARNVRVLGSGGCGANATASQGFFNYAWQLIDGNTEWQKRPGKLNGLRGSGAKRPGGGSEAEECEWE